jgi:hypothetical protein
MENTDLVHRLQRRLAFVKKQNGFYRQIRTESNYVEDQYLNFGRTIHRGGLLPGHPLVPWTTETENDNDALWAAFCSIPYGHVYRVIDDSKTKAALLEAIEAVDRVSSEIDTRMQEKYASLRYYTGACSARYQDYLVFMQNPGGLAFMYPGRGA